MQQVPKAQGKRTDIKPTDTAVGKYEVIEKAGFTVKQAKRLHLNRQNSTKCDNMEPAKSLTAKIKPIKGGSIEHGKDTVTGAAGMGNRTGKQNDKGNE